MPELRLVKIFAWTIGVLIMLWMFTECLGGTDNTDPGNQDPERDTEQYADDCENTWTALDLAASADHESVDGVLDQLDAIGADIDDPDLKALTADFARQAQQMVADADPGDADALEASQAEFRDDAALDLALRCPLR